jgi:hypothetical protein
MKEELEAQGFEYYDEPNAGEYVFQKYVDRGDKKITLRLYTSVSKWTDDSRDVGTDAIRLVVMGNGYKYGEGRVNRTQNWRKNLQSRIYKWDELYKPCPQCGNALHEKVGKYGHFMGCVTYPKCGYTERSK